MMKLHPFLFLPVFLAVSCATHPSVVEDPQPSDKTDTIPAPREYTEFVSNGPVTLASLLEEMTDCTLDAFFPSPSYVSLQASSTDPRSVSPDEPFWFANEDGTRFVRMEDANTKVIFEEEGPGVVTRIWTAGRFNQTINFFFDGETTPRIRFTGNDFTTLPWDPDTPLSFTHSHYNTKGGTSLYYPLPFGKSLKITVSVPEDFGVAYHIDYRRYEEGTEVETISANEAKRLKDKAAITADLLKNPVPWSGGTLYQTMEQVEAGGSLVMDLPKGECAIRDLSVKISNFGSNQRDVFRKLLVKMTFDGNETVWAPLDNFSGGGIGGRAVDNFYMTADGKGSCEWRFIMPYRDSARIELVNMNSNINPTVRLAANVDENFEWHTNSLYFFASFHQSRNLMTNNDPLSDNNREWTCTELEGKGVFKGDLLSLFNDKGTWYGEGDEKIYIDGEGFPSWFGTGMEDYYNTSFAPVPEFQNAFGGAVRVDNPSTSSGYNTWLRTRCLDDITFNSSFKFNWELLGWQPASLIMSSVVFWYGTAESVAVETSDKYELQYILP